MSKKTVLLIYPTIVGEIVNSLAQLASVFKEEGYKVHAQINTFKKQLTNGDFLEKAREVRPDIVAISTLTFEILNTYKLIKMFKDEGYIVIVGGPHATNRPEEVVKAGADIVIRNEGEETVKELCQYWREGNFSRDPEVLKEKWTLRTDKGLRVPEVISGSSEEGLGSILGITYFDPVRNKIRSTPPRERIVELVAAGLTCNTFRRRVSLRRSSGKERNGRQTG